MAESKTAGPMPVAQFFNLMQVRCSSREFFFDFAQIPGRLSSDGQFQEAGLLAALVTTPAHAKEMLEALKNSVGQYEERFGIIPREGPTPAQTEVEQ